MGAVLTRRLPLLGIATGSLSQTPPIRSIEPGIETIATGADHLQVLARVFNSIARCRHVRADVLLDAELRFVAEEDAPGVTAFRQDLHQLLVIGTLASLTMSGSFQSWMKAEGCSAFLSSSHAQHSIQLGLFGAGLRLLGFSF